MKKEPLVTIWILNYNGLHRLKKVLSSILNQKYNNKEILIVDNCSTDGSIEYIKHFPEIRLIENWKNLGYWAWKNILVRESKGEYILMLDNDIELIDDNLISKLLKKYNNLKNCYFLSPILIDIDKKDVTSHYGLFFSSVKKDLSVVKLRQLKTIKVGWFIWWAVFFKKTIFLQLWKYDEIYPFAIDDYDMSCRAYLQWWNCYVDTETYCIHHGIESNINKKTISFKYKYAIPWLTRIIIKNYLLLNLLFWLPIYVCWETIKSFKYGIKARTMWPIIENLKSFLKIIKDLKSTLKERKKIQKNRKVKEDVFLDIKIPKI